LWTFLQCIVPAACRPVCDLLRYPKVSFLKELFSFLRARKKLWLAPMLIVMALLGVLIVMTHGSAIAPFIYTLF
jgi:hypothetical protein